MSRNGFILAVAAWGLVVLALMLVGCTTPPDAHAICAQPPRDRALWDKACAGMHQPRRPPEGLCSDPDGRRLWPFDYTIRCKEK